MSEGLTTPSAPAESSASEASEKPVSRGWDDDPKEEKAEPKEKVEAKEEKPKPKPPKMRKIKIDGKEEFVDEDSVWRDYQKYRAGEKRLSEAAKLKQETEERLSRIKDDPYSVLSELGLDPSELSEKWLRQKLEEEFADVDPRDKQMRELQKRLEEYEGRERQAKEEEELSAREKFVESRKEALSKTLAEAMEATVLSKHPESQAALLREMAMYMRAAKEQGEDVSPQDLVEHLQSNRFRQYHTLANQFEGEELIEFLGKDVVNKIRKADLERLRGKRQSPAQSWKAEAPSVPQDKKSKFINPSDYRFALRNME